MMGQSEPHQTQRVPRPSRIGDEMKNAQDNLADAIIEAAHILSNNKATSPQGTSFGGLEWHGMTIGKSIEELAYQIGRIADAIEGYKNA